MACELWRLSSDLLVGVATFEADPDEPLNAMIVARGESLPAAMRWMSLSGLFSSQLKVLTISLLAPVNGPPLRTLEIMRKDGERILGPVALVTTDVKQKPLPDALKMLDSTERDKVVKFISSARTTHRCGRDDIPLSENLFAVREALREEFPSLSPDKEKPQGGSVELLLGIDDSAFYMHGWLLDREAPLIRVTAVAPEGGRVELLEGLFRYSRPDIEEYYGSSSDGSVSKPGFVAYFETDVPSRLSDGWVVEIENEAGRTGEMPAPPVTQELASATQVILGQLPLHALPDDELMSRHVLPAITRQQKHYKQLGNRVEVIEYGRRPSSPEISIVIPLYKRIDFLQHQLAQFALDPEVKASELIYVLDSPDLERQLRETAAQLHPLYGVPFVVMTQERSSGFAAATNIGTCEARGRLLVLLNSDILPDKPGWLGKMAAFYDERTIGALGPKLLYEDDSLQHAGMYFHLPNDTALAGIWANVHYFKGLDRDLTGACMMVKRLLYEEVGGFPEVYVQGDHEDSDLCLRLIEAGYSNWYVPQVELYHLEAQSYPDPLRRSMALYNRWLHTRRWNRLIQTVMARFLAGGVADTPGDLAEARSEAAISIRPDSIAEHKVG
jgi:GT2 family glycosyltransferase